MERLIGTDIHPQVNGMAPVHRHLPPIWRRRFEKHNQLASGFPYNRPPRGRAG